MGLLAVHCTGPESKFSVHTKRQLGFTACFFLAQSVQLLRLLPPGRGGGVGGRAPLASLLPLCCPSCSPVLLGSPDPSRGVTVGVLAWRYVKPR